jgi:DNA-binding response OmpR family regulator
LKILLVEDDLDLLDVTAYALRRERFVVIETTNGSQALHRLKIERPDLVVLDLGLPREDGFSVLERIREKDSTPVVVLTGRTREEDVLRAFTLGADDYVFKPFGAKQLAMRIRAILRRTSSEAVDQQQPALDIGNLRIEPEAQEVTWKGRFIRLTPTEFRILHLLAMHSSRVVTTSRLLAYVWGYDGGDPNALRTHISHLRTKLQLGTVIAGAITGVPGVGYRLHIEVDRSRGDLLATPVAERKALSSPAS